MTWDPLDRFNRWIFQKYKLDFSEISGDTIRHYRRIMVVDAEINISAITSWQILQDMGIYWIEIRTANGQRHELRDKYDCLVNILRQSNPNKEIPWEPAS